MTLEIKIGPPQIAIHHGDAVLLTEPDGQIAFGSDRGLYFRDTRLICDWSLYADGVPWDLLNGGALTSFAARLFLTNRRIETQQGAIPERTLGLSIGRQMDGGLREDYEIANHGRDPVCFNLELAVRCDFADVFEVKERRIVRRGKVVTEWDHDRRVFHTSYRNRDFHRAVTIEVHDGAAHPIYANGRISFLISLDPGQCWHAWLGYTLHDGEIALPPPATPIRDVHRSRLGHEMAEVSGRLPTMDAAHPGLAAM